MGGPAWHDPIHNAEFVSEMIAAASGGEKLSEHPSVLPLCDGGSNTTTTVAHSRARLLEILKACQAEVC